MARIELRRGISQALHPFSELILNAALEQCRYNENVSLLSLESNNAEKKYFAVRVNKNERTHQYNKVNGESTLPAVFSFQISDKHDYMAFERKQTSTSTSDKNIDILESILEALARYQAHILSSTGELKYKKSCDIRQFFDEVISAHISDDFDKTTVHSCIDRLSVEINKLFQDGLIVESIGFPLNNMKCTESNNIRKTILMPPIYDALLYIFTLTDELFRQYHLVNLIQNYFHILKASLDNKLSENVTKEYEEATVRLLLPVVKAQLVSRNQAQEDLRSNFLRYLKCPLINQEDVYESIYNVLKSTDYEFVNYDMKCLEQKNGHLGEYFHLNVRVKVHGDEQHLNLFVKVLVPSTEAMQDMVRKGPAEKEDFFYNTLLPLYEENGLGEYLDFAPKCYLSRMNWMIILSNAIKQGFTIAQINGELDYYGLKAVVIELAKFSAITLILEEKLSFKAGKQIRMVEIYPDQFREILLVNETGNVFLHQLDSTREAMHYFFELCPNIFQNVCMSPEDISKHIDEMYDSVFEKVRKSDQFKNVIAHGDMYLGNMLFRYGDNGLIDKSMLVDFQVLRYMPPAYELLFFLYLSSSRTTRLKYYNQLIEEYYQELSKILRRFDFDPEEVFPRESFDDSIKYMKSAALYMKVCYSTLTKMTPKLRETLFCDEEMFKSCFEGSKRKFIDMLWPDEDYKQAMADNVRDLADFLSV